MEVLIKHSFCGIIIALLLTQEAKSGENPNQNTKESLKQNTQSGMHNPLAGLILAESRRDDSEIKSVKRRVKRQFAIGYGDPYYRRSIPIIVVGGGFIGPRFGGPGFGGRGFGPGFGGRGFGPGFGVRGFGPGFGGRGFGPGFGGRGFGFGGRGFGGIGGRGIGGFGGRGGRG